MDKDQYSNFNVKTVLQITAAWTACFLLGPLIGWGIGEVLKNTAWAIPKGDTIIYIPLGLAIAQIMSGLFTALILRKSLSELKFVHMILITAGWTIVALITSYFMSSMSLFPD